MADALTILRADHESVLGMLEVLEGAGPSAGGRDEMVTNLIIAESRHEAVEQEIFWPAVRDWVPDGDQLADTALAQEVEGEKLLDRLEKGQPGEDDYEHALTLFLALARQHIAYEQNDVWPRVTESIAHPDLEQLGKRIEVAKKSAPTRPHPKTPPEPGVLKTMGAAAAAVDKLRDKLSGRGKHNPPDAPPS